MVKPYVTPPLPLLAGDGWGGRTQSDPLGQREQVKQIKVAEVADTRHARWPQPFQQTGWVARARYCKMRDAGGHNSFPPFLASPFQQLAL